MLDRARRRVGLSYSRFHFRGSRDRILSFTEAFTRARRALVLFPESPIDTDSSTAVLKYIARRYAAGGVVVIIRHDLKSAVSPVPWVKMVTYDKQDVSAWFTPRKTLIQRMKGTTYDVAFDLNVDFALTSAFLCKASNAPLRVSFRKDEGDRFYNFQIQTKGISNNPTSYRNFLRCLDMFS